MSEVVDRKDLFGRALPPGYRDEMRVLLAERPQEPSRRTGSSLLFQLGGLRLALPAQVASAVAPILHIARIPHRSGTVLLGIAAFRGDILPCCSLARLLNLGHAQTGAARTLVLEESPGRRWAVPIDGVLGIRAMQEQSAMADEVSQGALAAHWIKQTIRDEEGEFYLLDHELLFRQIMLATA